MQLAPCKRMPQGATVAGHVSCRVYTDETHTDHALRSNQRRVHTTTKRRRETRELQGPKLPIWDRECIHSHITRPYAKAGWSRSVKRHATTKQVHGAYEGKTSVP